MPLLNSGRDHICALLLGEAVTPYNAANAFIGVGNGTAAVVATQTNLQGASRARKAMDGTFPQRTGNAMTFRATFGTGDANFPWEEWIIVNNGTDATGVALSRKVEVMGTKTATATWQVTVSQTLTI